MRPHPFLCVSCRTCLLTACVLCLAAPAAAQGVQARLSAKTLAQFKAPSTGLPGAHTNRPFILASEEGLPELDFRPRLEREKIPGSCATPGGALCYDYRTGRAIYRPAREWMPDIQGMKRESLSVRRDRIVLHYSF